MENLQGLVKNPAEFGVFAAAHLGILAHRAIRHFTTNLPSSYHRLALKAEHIISYATRPLLFSSVMGLDLTQGSKVALAAGGAAVMGLIYDGIIPLVEDGRPQYRQLVDDAVGISLFVTATLLL